MIRGVDLAVYQGDLSDDMPRLKRLGAQFAIVKASQSNRTDPAFSKLFRAAKRAGLVVGAYHFLEEPAPGGQGAPVATQVSTFLNAVRKANGGTLNGVLLALDVEHYAPRGSNMKLKDVRAWGQAFRRAVGNNRPLLLYTSPGIWAQLGNPRAREVLGQQTYLWMAHWGISAGNAWDDGLGGLKAVIHQHGPFPPLRPRIVDGNVYRGTVAQLRELTRPKVAPAPEPTPEPEPTTETETDWRYSRPLQGLALRPLPSSRAAPIATAVYGSPLLVVVGRTGSSEAGSGDPSGLYVEVLGLGSHLVEPSLWARADQLARERPTLPPSSPPSVPPGPTGPAQ